jgi:predicted membrane protein (TIGR00267 family)
VLNYFRRLGLDPRYAMLGFLEGIIVALGLGAKAVLDPTETNAAHIVLNAGVITAVINFTTSWFTELYHERAELLELERKMVISQRGHYLRTALYRTRLVHTLYRAASFGVSALVGASTLLPAVFLFSGAPLLGLVVPLSLLFAIGSALGHKTAGRPIIWGSSMVLAGICVTFVGLLFPA